MSTLASVIIYNVASAKPAYGIPGQLFIASDTGDWSRDNGSSWDDVTPSGAAILTTKGDLLSFGTSQARLGVGTNGQVITANSTQTLGIKWAAGGGGGGGNINNKGTFAGLSSVSGMTSGDTYRCTDSMLEFIYDGSAWQAFMGGSPQLTLPPSILGASTTLNGGISSSVTSLTVNIDLGIATPFIALIGTEYMKVTAKSGSGNVTWTVSRGYIGSTAASHSNGDTVYKSNLAWINQGTATVDQGSGFTRIRDLQTGTRNARILCTLLPSAPYTLKVGFIPQNQYDANFTWSGCTLISSTLANVENVYIYSSGRILGYYKNNSPSSFNNSYVEHGVSMWLQNIMWLGFQDDGTNRKNLWSADGINWEVTASVSNTDFITPELCGIHVNAMISGVATAANFVHFSIT